VRERGFEPLRGTPLDPYWDRILSLLTLTLTLTLLFPSIPVYSSLLYLFWAVLGTKKSQYRTGSLVQ